MTDLAFAAELAGSNPLEDLLQEICEPWFDTESFGFRGGIPKRYVVDGDGQKNLAEAFCYNFDADYGIKLEQAYASKLIKVAQDRGLVRINRKGHWCITRKGKRYLKDADASRKNFARRIFG